MMGEFPNQAIKSMREYAVGRVGEKVERSAKGTLEKAPPIVEAKGHCIYISGAFHQT